MEVTTLNLCKSTLEVNFLSIEATSEIERTNSICAQLDGNVLILGHKDTNIYSIYNLNTGNCVSTNRHDVIRDEYIMGTVLLPTDKVKKVTINTKKMIVINIK